MLAGDVVYVRTAGRRWKRGTVKRVYGSGVLVLVDGGNTSDALSRLLADWKPTKKPC